MHGVRRRGCGHAGGWREDAVAGQKTARRRRAGPSCIMAYGEDTGLGVADTKLKHSSARAIALARSQPGSALAPGDLRLGHDVQLPLLCHGDGSQYSVLCATRPRPAFSQFLASRLSHPLRVRLSRTQHVRCAYTYRRAFIGYCTRRGVLENTVRAVRLPERVCAVSS